MPILNNARTAIIEPAKFVEYCLDPHHEDGRHKARVFKAVLGFERGTVVHVFESAEAYLVEFVSPTDGSTRALAELTPDQLAPVGG